MNIRYRRVEEGLWRDNIIGACMEKVAIAFTKDGVLHKHGDPRWVRQWFDIAVSQYCDSGLVDLAADMVYVESSNWDDETLDKILNISGFVGKWWDETALGDDYVCRGDTSVRVELMNGDAVCFFPCNGEKSQIALAIQECKEDYVRLGREEAEALIAHLQNWLSELEATKSGKEDEG